MNGTRVPDKPAQKWKDGNGVILWLTITIIFMFIIIIIIIIISSSSSICTVVAFH